MSQGVAGERVRRSARLDRQCLQQRLSHPRRRLRGWNCIEEWRQPSLPDLYPTRRARIDGDLALHLCPLDRIKGTEHVFGCTQVGIWAGLAATAAHDTVSKQDFSAASARCSQVLIVLTGRS